MKNRIIKFRAWETELEKMIPASHIAGIMLEPIDYELNHDRILHYSNSPISKAGYCLEDGLNSEFYILMQFTGLLDKNRKEIYEGDLLRHPAKEKWDETNYVVFEVFFHDNDCADKHIGFQFNRLHFQGSIAGYSQIENFLPKWTNKMEIIGNIYQNPELLAPSSK